MGTNRRINFDGIDRVLKTVKRIERTGYQDLLYEDDEKIVYDWNHIEIDRYNYEEQDFFGAPPDIHKDIDSRFALARLKIATCLHKRRKFPNVADTFEEKELTLLSKIIEQPDSYANLTVDEIRNDIAGKDGIMYKIAALVHENHHILKITCKFNNTELGLFEIIDEFRFFDDYSIEEIRNRIRRKEGEIYAIVKEYSEKIETNRDNIFENSQIKPGIALGIKIILNERAGKIQEGIIEYIRLYGAVQATNEIESAVSKVFESQLKRNQISIEVQGKINKLEQELEGVKEVAAQKSELEDKLMALERQVVQKDFEQQSLRNQFDLLNNEKSKVENSYLSFATLLEKQMKEVGDLKKQLEGKEAEIKAIKINLKQDLENENQRMVQEELEKIVKMKADLQLQVSEIEAEKQSLTIQKEEIREKFNSIKEAIEGGKTAKRFVTKDLAKLYEMDYIGRFDIKMNELPMSFIDPIDDKRYTVKSWGDNHLRMDERDKIYNQFKDKMQLSEIEAQLPLNVRSRYWINERGFIFGKNGPKATIEAMVLNHWKEYAINGFDIKPVTLSELNAVLVGMINKAEKEECFHVISIASPTGWDERIRTYISSEDFARNYVSRFISLCLVDIESGETIYNEADKRIKDFVYLFEPIFDQEKVQKCIEFIKTKTEYADHVVLYTIMEETGFNVNIVKNTFYDLEKEGYGKVMYVDEVGLVLKLESYYR
ncbi:hypothetical protein [uncultured Methanomethylovorans sp.]|uniref:hypothetical protein n=1 Tax=uncultured Methanomethylovorans sp. TaxID=183759 RepID=UPI002AA6FD3A|nr:hypothetical protein [uncultured Methanomethylovorans sp.]